MTPIKKTFQYGQHTVTLETGEIARQASGAVVVNMADTVVLVTVVADRKTKEDRDFLPLRVDYQERSYAAGRIPGGFFRREGRPSESEILTARLIDRPLRPLFPEGFTNEVQIVATVMSLNSQVDPEIPALLGASAAVALSGVPFQGSLGAARVGYRDGQYLLNPTRRELKDSQLDLVVAGTERAVLMVESEADELSEAIPTNPIPTNPIPTNPMKMAIRTMKAKTAKAKGRPVKRTTVRSLTTKVQPATLETWRASRQRATKVTTKVSRTTVRRANMKLVVMTLQPTLTLIRL